MAARVRSRACEPMSSAVANAISIVGSALSLIGVAIAVWQIFKTRKAAEAAQNAVEATRRSITSNVVLADMSSCTRAIEEVKALVRAKRYEPALLRVTDLHALIIQLQHVTRSDGKADTRAREALTGLSVLRDLLEEKLDNDEIAIETAKVNSELAKISDGLGHWIGDRKLRP